MRTALLVLGLIAGVGLVCGGVYGWLRWREDQAQNERDRSGPAFCTVKPYRGINDVCWTDSNECGERKLECEPVHNYACFRAEAMTDGQGIKWCKRSYGDCVDFRASVLHDAEYRDVTECLVYRTTGGVE